ncbi:CheR family methyltransferase [Legionella rowbothamii]|uniref:CheR family methyltransferase n=1 Tax=Legionella rowbothamii TaxID=96229 RepID=UPI0010544BA1|nr:CheR family methyltransferase [Legionella rowbothamii]
MIDSILQDGTLLEKLNTDPKIMKKKKTTSLIPNLDDEALSSPFIVAIGASAGGLESLKTFFMHSFENANIAYVIITHLSPTHESHLPELLQSCTSIKVESISNHQKILGNHIYVLPPGKLVTIQRGELELIDPNTQPIKKLPIDFFLAALAQDQGKKAICIILSGMGHDGSIGLRVLRENGGLVIAQNTQSARFEGMPKSAINTGLVDYILPPEKIYSFLIKYIAHLNNKIATLDESIFDEIQKILKLIKHHTGHDFSLYKSNTLFRRIQKRLGALCIHNLSDYIYYIHQHPSELNILFKELLINVTSFFRDPDAFEVLKKELLEKILAHKDKNRDLRIWVPGCSTGEEAYSIAIIVYECMQSLKLNYNVQIFGTDIDEDAIKIARAGVYPLSINADISSERLQQFFIKDNDSYKINIEIRKMIIFAVQNIIKDPPFTRLDLLSCRNLFIYLSSELQKKIFPLLHYSLLPKGLLFLGTSETIGSSSNFFNTVDKKWKIFERNQRKSSFISNREITFKNDLPTNATILENNMQDTEQNLSNLIKNILLKYYVPACVVIDEKGMIVYVYGKTSKFLEFPSGEVRLSFLDMIRPELRSVLHSAIHKAFEQQKEIILDNLQIKENDVLKYINIKIRPINKNTLSNKLLLILLEDTPQAINEKIEPQTKDKKVTQLEQELKYTKENLQTTIEELETSNEELKSSNEELQSTNEELQSTNEEIETSKEELQSLNEELSTVNTELENRIELLSSANDDIKNLLDNTELATIFLDKNLCIKRFTPKATEIINLIATDVGRPVSHIVSNLEYEKLVEDARTVLQTLEPISKEGIDKKGHWYVIRIIPYRTVSGHIEGVVVTFLNIHSQKKAENKLCTLENELTILKESNTTLLNAIPSPAIILTIEAKIIMANTLFLARFNMPIEEVEAHSIYKLKLGWDITNLKNLIEKLLPSQKIVENYNFKISETQTSQIKAQIISSSIILLIFSDI